MEVSVFQHYLGMLLAQYEWGKSIISFCAFQSLPEHLPKPKDLHSRAEQSARQTLTVSPQVQSAVIFNELLE